MVASSRKSESKALSVTKGEREDHLNRAGVLAFVGSLFVLAATLVLVPASMAFLTPPRLSLEKEERTI
jgi:hypothetical protein